MSREQAIVSAFKKPSPSLERPYKEVLQWSEVTESKKQEMITGGMWDCDFFAIEGKGEKLVTNDFIQREVFNNNHATLFSACFYKILRCSRGVRCLIWGKIGNKILKRRMLLG